MPTFTTDLRHADGERCVQKMPTSATCFGAKTTSHAFGLTHWRTNEPRSSEKSSCCPCLPVGPSPGDLRVARAFEYIRSRFPFWNRTVRSGHPRHLMLLPCDHGPGDCAFSRPIVPYKYAPWAADGRPGMQWHKGSWMRDAYGAQEIMATWATALGPV